MFWPPCTPTGTKDTTCIVDGWSVAGLAATITGLAGTVLALLGAFAVAAWWTNLDARVEQHVNEKVIPLIQEIQGDAIKTREALVYLSLGDRLLEQRDVEQALKNYKEAGKLLPHDVLVQSMLGRIYSGAGDYETAINTFQATLNLLEETQPLDAVRLGNVEKELGLAYRRRNKANKQEADADYDTAIQHLKKATVLNPADSDTLAILGGLYRRKGEYAQAYDNYKRAWNANPASSYALSNVASLAWYEGKRDDARMYFGFAEMVATDHIKKGQGEIYWDYYDLALAQLALGNVAEAQKKYAIAIKETPGKMQFDGVLDNLHLLQKASQPIPGLNDIVKMIETEAKRV